MTTATDPAVIARARTAKATRLAVAAREGGLTPTDLVRPDIRRALLRYTPRRGGIHRHVADTDLAAVTWSGASDETWALTAIILATLLEVLP